MAHKPPEEWDPPLVESEPEPKVRVPLFSVSKENQRLAFKYGLITLGLFFLISLVQAWFRLNGDTRISAALGNFAIVIIMAPSTALLIRD